MAERIGYEFPTDDSDQWDGFNDPGIEHFSGTPYAGLGREVPQNVVDAMHVAPARIAIRLIEVPTDSIPDADQLKSILERCRKAAESEGDKAVIFFNRAIELLKKRKVNVLQISDYNTTGVKGPCENGTPYYALLKASARAKNPEPHL